MRRAVARGTIAAAAVLASITAAQLAACAASPTQTSHVPLPTIPAFDPPSDAASLASLAPMVMVNYAVLGDACNGYVRNSAIPAGPGVKVGLAILGSENGRVADIRVVTTSGVPALDEAAKKCISDLAVVKAPPLTSDGRAPWQRMNWTWRRS